MLYLALSSSHRPQDDVGGLEVHRAGEVGVEGGGLGDGGGQGEGVECGRGLLLANKATTSCSTAPL